jgi:multidrug efflux pump subunit AcrA (membrane-fusion protein)
MKISMTTIKSRVTFFYKNNKKTTLATLTLLAVGIVSLGVFSKTTTEAVSEQQTKQVSLITVGDTLSGGTSLPLLGTVTSVSEAVIRSETSGKLTRVYRKLGDYVDAGQVIAEFENSGERASVLQAEGALEQAQAAKKIASISSGTSATGALDAKTSAQNALSQTYNTLDDSVRVKTDQAYSNPRTDDVALLLTVPDQALVSKLENTRELVEGILISRDAKNKTLSQIVDWQTELTQAQKDLEAVKSYLDALAEAYAKAIPDGAFTQAVLDANKSLLSQARSQVSASVSAIIQAKSAVSVSMSQEAIAGVSTGESGSTGTSDAQIKQAQGAYNAALSRLQKTIIRSPLSGTLNSLSIQTGDFVSAFSEVGVVSNNGALEVVAYVTEDESRRIIPGTKVTLDGGSTGIITRVAPAIDPTTKKIEVRVALVGKSTLINGQSVTAQFVQAGNTATKPAANSPVTIPLTALKLTPTGTFVFSVDADNMLQAIPITTGSLMGDRIIVLTGISRGVKIVEDARGLKALTTVIVK